MEEVSWFIVRNLKIMPQHVIWELEVGMGGKVYLFSTLLVEFRVCFQV